MSEVVTSDELVPTVRVVSSEESSSRAYTRNVAVLDPALIVRVIDVELDDEENDTSEPAPLPD